MGTSGAPASSSAALVATLCFQRDISGQRLLRAALPPGGRSPACDVVNGDAGRHLRFADRRRWGCERPWWTAWAGQVTVRFVDSDDEAIDREADGRPVKEGSCSAWGPVAATGIRLAVEGSRRVAALRHRGWLYAAGEPDPRGRALTVPSGDAARGTPIGRVGLEGWWRSLWSGCGVEEPSAVDVEVAEHWWAVGQRRWCGDRGAVDEGLPVGVDGWAVGGVAGVHPDGGPVVA